MYNEMINFFKEYHVIVTYILGYLSSVCIFSQTSSVEEPIKHTTMAFIMINMFSGFIVSYMMNGVRYIINNGNTQGVIIITIIITVVTAIRNMCFIKRMNLIKDTQYSSDEYEAYFRKIDDGFTWIFMIIIHLVPITIAL